MSYVKQVEDILDGARVQLSDLLPADWSEKHRFLTTDVSSRPGPHRYDYTPYMREIINCLSPEHPSRIVAIQKGAQVGTSLNLIESGIGWIISQCPGNILFLTGHADLAEESMNQRIDAMIDSCGLRPMIRPNVLRTKNQRTGDTNKSKEFPGGWLIAGSGSNHKLLRQRSARYGFFDDFDAVKQSSVQAGDTRKLFEQRFAAYYDKMKIIYSSSPELKSTSNIEPVYLLGDQRKYNIPCQCCGEYIPLVWNMEIAGTKETAGITWKVDNHGVLIPGSVGYVCQMCGGFFDDGNKYEFNLQGEWRPTATPSEAGYYSYHISSLYAPPGMYDWEFYTRQFMEANPPSGRKENLYKTFVNVCLGETYEHKGAAPDANQVQAKTREYQIGVIPEWMSEKDGNGKIIMLTCACDLNGTEQDARLDYEIVAWSESGSSYSIKHGSIGTFIPRESQHTLKIDRERWTYEHYKSRSVWTELEKVITEVFSTDTGRKMKILVTGIDCGHYTNHAYAFVDGTTAQGVIGIKGDKEEKYRKYKQDMALFKPAKERGKLYLLDVNYIKDLVADCIKLEWTPRDGVDQPPGYMNFPQSSGGLYSFNGYFKHYEAEHRTDDVKDGTIVGTRWVKKGTNEQNHFWDCYVYGFALKEMWAAMVLKEAKLKGTWSDYVAYVLGK
jgi:phage terminase large subunit GpA-like protein